MSRIFTMTSVNVTLALSAIIRPLILGLPVEVDAVMLSVTRLVDDGSALLEQAVNIPRATPAKMRDFRVFMRLNYLILCGLKILSNQKKRGFGDALSIWSVYGVNFDHAHF